MARRSPSDGSPPLGGTDSPPARAGMPGLPPWVDPTHPPLHGDFSVRIVLAAADAVWQPSSLPGIEVRLLELLPGDLPRASAQLRLAAGVEHGSLGAGADVELLVQAGEVDAIDSAWPAGVYARLPVGGEETFGSLTLHADRDASALLYVAAGHIAPGDTEQRRIDTSDASRWLPGPVEGTEVLPLHGHGSGNVMLIRWLGAVAFRPRLDPLGEEVLVLEGCLHDADGSYPAGSWIRNPVPAWQSWSADPGTLIYYKNGHFATPPDGGSLPFPTRTQ